MRIGSCARAARAIGSIARRSSEPACRSLAGADLTDATIGDADLRGADLTGAVLPGVDLDRAQTSRLIVKSHGRMTTLTTRLDR
jgi:uncharacterized protein YjbI with pentapeptide repeats